MSIMLRGEGDPAPRRSDVQRELVAQDATPLIEMKNVGVKESWGLIYGPVSFTVPRGGVTVLAAPRSRGRTALLLTLAGRMKPTFGDVTGFGEINKPHHLFKNSGIAFIDEVDEIPQAVRVRDIVTEQLRWSAPWYRWVKQSRDKDLESICRPVFGEYSIPAMTAYVEELPELTSTLFRIAVANVHRPPLLVVGGVDLLSSIQASQKLMGRLVALGEHQTVITSDINRGRGMENITKVIDVPNVLDKEFVPFEEEALR